MPLETGIYGELRIARPTAHMDEVIASFEDHAGFDGLMLAQHGAAYHLEFTHNRGNGTHLRPIELPNFDCTAVTKMRAILSDL